VNSYAELIISSSRKDGIIVDTNLLLLLIVGMVDPSRIEEFKRTRKFTAIDFDTVASIVSLYSKIITTPHILSEVSDLLESIGRDKQLFFENFADSISNGMIENHIEIDSLIAQDEFFLLGVADTGIFELAKQKYLVLTDDLPLTLILESNKLFVINFTHHLSKIR